MTDCRIDQTIISKINNRWPSASCVSFAFSVGLPNIGINFKEIRLVDNKGEYHQKVSMTEARNIASFSNLDLVCFNQPNAKSLALCKIIDFGKWKYSEEKKKKKLNKENKRETKEMRFSPAIGENDIRHKVRQVNGFLEELLRFLVSTLSNCRHALNLRPLVLLFVESFCFESGKACQNSEKPFRNYSYSTPSLL